MQIYEKQLIDALVESLQATGMVQVETRTFDLAYRSGKLDCLLQLDTPLGVRHLAVEIMKNAYPRDIRNAVWQLENFQHEQRELSSPLLMVAAEHISEGAKQELKHRGIAFFEMGGTLHLRKESWFIDIQRQSLPTARRSTTSLFTEAREQVIHALLHARDRWMSGLELADLSQASTYTVSTVLSELDRLEWITSEGGGRTLRRKLSRPGELLDAWAQAWRQRRDTRSRWYFYVPDPARALEQAAACLKKDAASGIFTGAAAANMLVSRLTGTDMIDLIIPPGSAGEYASLLKLKSAEKGTNFTLIERAGTSRLFTQEAPLADIRFASPFILYLDLLDGKGRNKELAGELRQQQLQI